MGVIDFQILNDVLSRVHVRIYWSPAILHCSGFLKISYFSTEQSVMTR